MKAFGRSGSLIGLIVIVAMLVAAPAASARAPGQARRSTVPRITLHATRLGRVLAGRNGHTLYLHVGDYHSHSTCNGACLKAWPAFRARVRPLAGIGVHRWLIRIYRYTHGGQVAYARHLLYYFIGDKAPGQVKGEGLGGFYAVTASGKRR